MEPITYFKKWGFSINEGGGPVNIHCCWRDGLYFYLFVYWFRLWFRIGKNSTFRIERNRGLLWHLKSNKEPKLVSGGTFGYEEVENFLEKLFK